MIVKFVYQWEKIGTKNEKQRIVSVECDCIVYTETKKSWRVVCLKGSETIRDKEFAVTDKVYAFVVENGQTVDRLPRR